MTRNTALVEPMSEGVSTTSPKLTSSQTQLVEGPFMYRHITLWLLLLVISYISRGQPGYSILGIAVWYYVIGIRKTKSVRPIYDALFLAAFVLGSCWADNLQDFKDETALIKHVSRSIAVGGAQLLAILSAQQLINWFETDSRTSTRCQSTLTDQLVFPTIWFLLQEVFFRHDIHGFLGTQATMYPTWMIGNRIEPFLDAAYAQTLAVLAIRYASVEKPISGETVTVGEKDKLDSVVETPRGSLRTIRNVCCLALSVTLLMGLMGAVFSFWSDNNPDLLRVGCIRPKDVSSSKSVLEALQEQVIKGNAISLLPASASYISEVPDFVRFKQDIAKITDLSTVVVPTMSFSNETACHMRMKLQIYPLGEEKFLNSYTAEVTKKTGPMVRERIDIKSLFLTWRSRRVSKRQGSLSIACAICLDSEFPRIFQTDHTPDLLMIPNSAWSSAVNGSRIEHMRTFARSTKTAVLFCDLDRSGYVDSTGRLVSHSGTGSFSINYDQTTRGHLVGLHLGLWWVSIPLALILWRIRQHFQMMLSGRALDREAHI